MANLRLMVSLLVFCWATTASGQTTLQSPNGAEFEIRDTTSGGLVGPDAFAEWPQFCVRRCDDCDPVCAQQDVYDAGGAPSALELNGRQLRMATMPHPTGVELTRRVFVPSAGGELADGFIRYLDTIHNPQAEPITVSVRIGTTTQLGGRIADDVSTIWRTQSDDATLQTFDRWLVLDDESVAGGRWATGVLLQGAGSGLSLRRISQGFPVPDALGSLAWDFVNIAIPAGESRSLMTFVIQNPDRQDTLSETRSLHRVRTVDALFGLTDRQRETVVNFDVNPANASPVADAGGPYTVEEGRPVELTGLQSFDAESIELSYAWDLNDDGQLVFDDADTANTIRTFLDDGIYQVALRVTDTGDENGAGRKSDSDTARVQVLNVAPRIDAIATNSPINEGDRLDVEVRVTEPGADTIVARYDWDGDGLWDTEPTEQLQQRPRYLADGTYDLTVYVADDDGGEAVRTTQVVVRNMPPMILDVVVPERAFEGSTVDLQVVAVDRGGDPLTYEYDIDGDLGGVYEISGVDIDRVAVELPNDGLKTVRLRVCDDQGECVEREVLINVENARPVIENINVTSPIDEGSNATVIVTASDVVGDDLTYAFDFDNDGDFEDDVPGQESNSIEIPFADDGLFTVGVKVEDGDGGRALDSVMVQVINVAPTVRLTGPDGTRQGVEETFQCDATDPGADGLIYDWDFDGDGQFELRRGRAQEVFSFPNQADLTIACRVSDGDGGETIAQHRVIVSNERPTLSIQVDSPQNEGSEVVIRAIAQDLGADVLEYWFDFENDGEFDLGPTNNPIARHIYPDQGQYSIRVVVSDGTDQIDSVVPIRIVNLPPNIRLLTNTPISEGEALELRAVVSDPGNDLVTLRWDLDGDGDADIGAVDPVIDGEVMRRFVVPDDGRFTVTVWADDGEGGVSEALAAVTVRNLAPSIIDNYRPPDAYEGQPYNRSIPASDPAGVLDPLEFSLVEPPPGIDIERVTGVLLWVPNYNHVVLSPLTLRIRIDDGDGGTTQEDVEFIVHPIDEDADGLPDSYEERTCNAAGECLDPTNPDDANDDPDMDGRDNRTEWAEGTGPFEYDGPDLTQHLLPENGLRVPTLTPDLVVSFVEDSRGEQVQVQMQVFADEMLQNLVAESEFVDQPADSDTTWAVPTDTLAEDAWYWWRARISTESAQTPWTDPWSFRTNSQNTPPTSPMPLAPPDGAMLDSLQPLLRVTVSTDADEDQLRYIFRVYDQADEIFTSGEGVVVDGEVHFDTPPLVENSTFTWDAVAIDEASAESETWQPYGFSIDATNSVPGAPEIYFPVAEEFVETLRPAFEVGGSEDLDEEALSYVMILLDADGTELETSEALEADSDNRVTWTPSESLAEDNAYILSAYAVDVRAGVSDTSTQPFFVSADNGAPPVPEPTSPVDGAQVLPSDVVLYWSSVEDPEGKDVTYVVEYCAADACIESRSVTSAAIDLSGQLDPGVAYTWRVRASDPQGMSGGFSESSRFSTLNVGGADGDSGCDCSLASADDSSRVPVIFLVLIALIRTLRRPQRGRSLFDREQSQ